MKKFRHLPRQVFRLQDGEQSFTHHPPRQLAGGQWLGAGLDLAFELVEGGGVYQAALAHEREEIVGSAGCRHAR